MDPVINKKIFIPTRDIILTLVDQDGNPIQFNSNSINNYFQIVLFHYKIRFFNILNDNVRKLLAILLLKLFKKELS